MEPIDEDRWTPLFEPTDFNNQHQPLEIEHYRLSEADLKSWAERCMALRATIVERSRVYADNEPEELLQNVGARTLRGTKRSKSSHNIEGRTEDDLRKQRHHEKAPCRKFKKRHRKDLSLEEVEEIVNATK